MITTVHKTSTIELELNICLLITDTIIVIIIILKRLLFNMTLIIILHVNKINFFSDKNHTLNICISSHIQYR